MTGSNSRRRCYKYLQLADVLVTHTVVLDTLRAENLNSVHRKEVLEEMNKLIEEKVIAGDAGEEIILKNGLQATNVYSDRTHVYISPSGRCWLDWSENHRRYVRRLGCTPV